MKKILLITIASSALFTGCQGLDHKQNRVPASVRANSSSKKLHCHGTEPFWSAEVSSQSVKLDFADEKTTFPITSQSAYAGLAEGAGHVYSNNNGPIAVVISNSCTDGMSDNTYSREIVIHTGTSSLYGCCK